MKENHKRRWDTDPEYKEALRNRSQRWKATAGGKKRSHAANYKSAHGIDISSFETEQMLVDQGGRCAICQKPIAYLPGRGTVKNAHLDHDHETMRIRQWLCSPCNRGLGCFLDRPEVLRAAAEYLDRHKLAHTIPDERVIERFSPPAGEEHRNHKLTEAAIREAQVRLDNGATVAELARELGVTSRTLSKAVTGESWQHLA